jgi:ferric-dicitrate binding protein FerR (iron transport regulator)
MPIPNDQLLDLFRRYASGDCSRQELLQLFEAIRDAQQDEVILQSLQSLWQQVSPDDPLPALDREKIFHDIISGVPKDAKRMTPVRRLVRMRVAAAILLLVMAGGIGYSLLRQPGHSPRQTAGSAIRPGNDVAPGGNKAVLILSNGSQIELDSARSGEQLGQEGARVTKQGSDRLVYAGDGDGGQKGTAGLAVQYNTVRTPRGGQYQVVLVDGTKVWLNAASSLKFPVSFTGGDRVVELTGEAYFEVAHDKMPFKVRMGNGREVQVLGTHFNVNAYDDEAVIRTTLLEGSVRFVADGSGKVLKPGQQAVVSNGASAPGSGASIEVISDADVEGAVAWKNGYFQFNGADTKTVMRQLSRWYDINVKYEGPVPERSFGGGIQRNLHLSAVLRVLEESNVHFRIEGNILVVTP